MSWTTTVAQPSELGESPFWHPDEQLLYWVDIAGKKIHRSNVFMGTVESWAMAAPHELEPGCIAPARSGGLVVALRDGIYRARTWGGALEKLADAAHDPRTTRFNDGKCDPLGRFWAGTIYEPRAAREAALYCLDGRAGHTPALVRMAGDATVGNGLAWSADSRTLYWADTTGHVIRAWDWDAAGNTLARQRVFRQFPPKPPGWQAGMPGYGGRPDGAAVDSQGNYWVAMYEGGRVLKLSPGGELLADIPTPVVCPTMVCFGGDDLQTLYLTTARHGRPAAELEVLPQSGCVFSMRVDVPGLPVHFFADAG
ncbi:MULTISPECIES: SMP-30/gluconolactonase/LRE family protein [unclassified Polaromonas]|jgi:sugar lactone lactonase YvrE|uniref:SMP-30/gluconolactonase/LRE family protein n=1 Tax=unclassified Polaromonas TaxID=2638319 RepID=UPI000BDC98A1|nr:MULTISPECIES: SMP-30/gluconolactonase/LRE family protein [unclassified Polaromonas]OYY38454.1 MAG: gluconolactonase [Polaromonas sp. 35-63-35]OYZ21388.1 MAG: gluconolactonase [Polaromonas sp. 16-63-31]OYZ79145.1 MAG: gluconolactonase [Polaromonas sp. 24-63-21]OZA50192.1 MAG: gluconolactonase [Polaromonas sp. 17-63-33]OZA89313.1 MAG: gluconolactonase [Polaromonas sp. 39-63-25]